MKQPGYILVLTLMITSILIIVVTGVFYNSIAQIAFTKTIIDREKAKVLALSGIQLAIDKLTIPEEPPKKPDPNKKAKEPKDNKSKQLLKRILPRLNRWQTINLEEKTEGIDGQIKICITSEDGKININKLFDYKTHKFLNEAPNPSVKPSPGASGKPVPPNKPKADARLFLQTILASMFEYTKNKDLFPELQSFLQKRKFPINDITELVTIPKFSYFQDNLFYEPTMSKGSKQPIYLTDIFTIWTDSEKVQPWLFSDSLCALLGLKRVKLNDENERTQIIDEWLKNFNDTNNWQTDWDKSLKPVYGKDFKNISKNIQPFLSDKFAPKIFSVISYGTVGVITQRLIVILEVNSKDSESNYAIKKLYWN
ncbi:MAG: hypothetical protein P4L22_05430 [Candidatus Babeliales bacterium]|nr:hypothetical protein [Candidatus Babeliales bacterium]